MDASSAALAKAQSWVGMTERTGNNDIKFNDDWGLGSGPNAAWCLAMVESAWLEAGRPLPIVTFYCPTGIQWARDHGQAVEAGHGDPLPGDIVFFSWDMAEWPRDRPGTGDHVGFVESWDGGDTIRTIEGNVGPAPGVSRPQGVHRRTRSISKEVICFWRPYGGAEEDDMFDDPARNTQNAIDQRTTTIEQRLNAFIDEVRDGFSKVTTLWIAFGTHMGMAGPDNGLNSAYENIRRVVQEELAALPVAQPQVQPSGQPGDPSIDGRLRKLEQDFADLLRWLQKAQPPAT